MGRQPSPLSSPRWRCLMTCNVLRLVLRRVELLFLTMFANFLRGHPCRGSGRWSACRSLLGIHLSATSSNAKTSSKAWSLTLSSAASAIRTTLLSISSFQVLTMFGLVRDEQEKDAFYWLVDVSRCPFHERMLLILALELGRCALIPRPAAGAVDNAASRARPSGVSRRSRDHMLRLLGSKNKKLGRRRVGCFRTQKSLVYHSN